jgi:hypothetical protein
MNYLKVYCNLIRKAEKRGYTKKKAKEYGLYVEGHHTFPVSIFGKNKRIVYLTAREHYIAHALLKKIFIWRYGLTDYRTKKMIYAFWRLNNEVVRNTHFNSYLYEKTKNEFANLMKNESIFSTNNPSKKEKNKIKNSKRMSEYLLSLTNEEYGKKYKNRIEKTKIAFKGEGNPFYNRKHTQDVKDRLSKLSKMSKWWNNGKENRQCKECPGEGWVLGMYYENNPSKGKKRDSAVIEKVRNSNCKYVYTFISPQKELFVTNNARQFCIKNQLQHSKITMILQNKRSHHKGWTVTRERRIEDDK